MTPYWRDVLQCPLHSDDVDALTVGQYLSSLLIQVWTETEGFDGKRPFGNSNWEMDVYEALWEGGVVPVGDYYTADSVLLLAIEHALVP